jgi:hypothetical protein
VASSVARAVVPASIMVLMREWCAGLLCDAVRCDMRVAIGGLLLP